MNIEGCLSLMSVAPSNPILSLSKPFTEPSDVFQPPWIFRNGHVQTLVGTYVFGRDPNQYCLPTSTATLREVSVADGDRLSYHDDCPAPWKLGDRVALLLHGLAGSHDSSYMRRLAKLLYQHHVRVFRLNWRGCGTGMPLARYPYHSGRSDDLRAAIASIRTHCPASPLTVIGFSMGGNVALKLLGEGGVDNNRDTGITKAVAVCPPIDLSSTIEFISVGLAGAYNSYFTKTCIRNVRSRQLVRPDAIIPDNWFLRPPRTMREFDETFTAPICGFASAADYYARSSAFQFLPTIKIPTLIVAAQDDPVIPFQPFTNAVLSPSTQLLAPKHGGHVGFITHAGPGWLDQQILNWTLSET